MYRAFSNGLEIRRGDAFVVCNIAFTDDPDALYRIRFASLFTGEEYTVTRILRKVNFAKA